MDAMGDPNPPRPPWLDGEVLDNRRLPGDLVRALLDWLGVTGEDGGPLSSDTRSVQGIHAFLGNLASRMDIDPGLECPALIGV